MEEEVICHHFLGLSCVWKLLIVLYEIKLLNELIDLWTTSGLQIDVKTSLENNMKNQSDIQYFMQSIAKFYRFGYNIDLYA